MFHNIQAQFYQADIIMRW